MKFLTFIFAFYILLLPCFPCADVEECPDNSKTEMAGSSGNHSNHQNEEENCNPFCSCACCGNIFVPNFQLTRIAFSKPVDNKKQFFYNNVSLSSDYFGNIWQPPKFG